MQISFSVFGEPVGKARPRFNRQSGAVYTPQATMSYEQLIRDCYTLAARNTPDWLGPVAIGPVTLRILAVMTIPHSYTAKKRDAAILGELAPTKKPDWDNIGKLICDALNGYAYKDDSQVCHATVVKRFGREPRVTVELHAPD